MVTDLRHALRDAVADEPPDGLDFTEVIGAGARRARRRRVVTGAVAACVAGVLAVVAVVTAQVGRDRAGESVRPARPAPPQVGRPLLLGDAATVEPAPLATTRTLWLDPANDLDYDRLDGLTTDGKVVRA